jgi:hypothetical protein
MTTGIFSLAIGLDAELSGANALLTKKNNNCRQSTRLKLKLERTFSLT